MSKFQDVLKKYLDIFRNDETYFVNDRRNLELFKSKPANTSREDIMIKLNVLDDTELIELALQQDMAKRILELKIDPRLAKGDLTVVPEIAEIKVGAKSYKLLHVASQYCNLHRPELFPVYASEHLNLYRRYIKELKLNVNPDQLDNYLVFTQVLKELIKEWGLEGKMNFLEVRKFGWLYATRVVEESD